MLSPALRAAHQLTAYPRALAAEATYSSGAAVRWLRGFGPEHVSVPSAADLRTTVLRDTPVMLVHGLGANKSYFAKLERTLNRAGYTVYCVNYTWLNANVADCGRHVAQDAARFLAETGGDRIHVVAHSLGGVVLRWALTHTDLRARIGLGVTLGSPHGGTPLAQLAPVALPLVGPLLGQLRPDAPELADLADPGDMPEVRMVAVGGGLDCIVPGRRALLPHRPNVRNRLVPDTGHIAMSAHRDVIAVVLEELAAVGRPGAPVEAA